MAAGYDAVVIFNEGQPGRQELLDRHTRRDLRGPRRRALVRGRRGARRGRLRGRRRHARRHLDGERAGSDHLEPDRRDQEGREGPAGRRRRAPRLRLGGAGHQRQRLRHRDDPRGRRGDGRGQDRSRGARCSSPSGARRRPACSGRSTTSRSSAPGSPTSTRTSTSTCSARPTTSGSSMTATAPADGTSPGLPARARSKGCSTATSPRRACATEPTAFDGRSDYGPFIAAGVPAGGLFTGRRGREDAGAGGRLRRHRRRAYDPCYHQACDDINEPEHQGAQRDVRRRRARRRSTLARSKSGFFEDGSRVGAKKARSRTAWRTARTSSASSIASRGAASWPPLVRVASRRDAARA